jgi:hypothetical protein
MSNIKSPTEFTILFLLIALVAAIWVVDVNEKETI